MSNDRRENEASFGKRGSIASKKNYVDDAESGMSLKILISPIVWARLSTRVESFGNL